MKNGSIIHNAPRFITEAGKSGFQEVWYLKLNDPGTARALWLRFTILIHRDKSKEVAEVWAIFFEHDTDRTRKAAAKQTYPLNYCVTVPASQNVFNGLRIEDNYLGEDKTNGHIHNDTTRIAWDLQIVPGAAGGHDFVPDRLRKLGLVKNLAVTVFEQQRYTGWCEVNETRYAFTAAPGMQGHLAGPQNGHSWSWGHCNCFVDDAGAPAGLIWDGLSARAKFGGLVPPALTSMFIQIGRETLFLNTVMDALRFQSHCSFDGWHFTTTKNRYSFEGNLTARLDDFACVTYEDTDGSNLYCHNTKLADMTLTVTSPEGRRTRYTSTGTTAYEVVTREPHPDIPVLL